MNKEKEKTAEELAYYVKSDLDIQEIVKKFQHDLQELDYGNRVAAIRKAIEHLNQGCTVNYVVDGLREWYGITIDTDELKKILLQSKDLLPEDERYKNADKNILTVEIPDDKQRIDLAYLQHKYKLGYYRCQDGVPFEQRVTVNYDHPDSLETDLLIEHLKELKAGRSIDSPVYDYSQHNRSHETVRIDPKPIIIVEGILFLADERLRSLLDIKVYVEADSDERILRRISRDVSERGRDLNGIIEQYLTTVKPMHYLYVEPTRSKADVVINSGKNDVEFDLFVSKIGQLLEEREKEN